MHSAAKHIKFSMDEIMSAHFSEIKYLFVFCFYIPDFEISKMTQP